MNSAMGLPQTEFADLESNQKNLVRKIDLSNDTKYLF